MNSLSLKGSKVALCLGPDEELETTVAESEASSVYTKSLALVAISCEPVSLGIQEADRVAYVGVL